MIKICCVNQNEIICLQYIQQKIAVFDFKFVELFRFDKQVMYGSIETYSMSNYLYSSDSFYYYSVFLDYAKKKAILNRIKKSDLALEKSLEIELAGIKSINWIVFNMNELHIKDKCQNTRRSTTNKKTRYETDRPHALLEWKKTGC